MCAPWFPQPLCSSPQFLSPTLGLAPLLSVLSYDTLHHHVLQSHSHFPRHRCTLGQRFSHSHSRRPHLSPPTPLFPPPEYPGLPMTLTPSDHTPENPPTGPPSDHTSGNLPTGPPSHHTSGNLPIGPPSHHTPGNLLSHFDSHSKLWFSELPRSFSAPSCRDLTFIFSVAGLGLTGVGLLVTGGNIVNQLAKIELNFTRRGFELENYVDLLPVPKREPVFEDEGSDSLSSLPKRELEPAPPSS